MAGLYIESELAFAIRTSNLFKRTVSSKVVVHVRHVTPVDLRPGTSSITITLIMIIF